MGLAFIVGQAFAMSHARVEVARELHVLDSNARLYDDALTAYPSNPMCWTFTTIEQSGENYRLRTGVVSLAPSLIRPETCPRLFGQGADLKALGETMLETSQESASVAELRSMDRSNCHLHAWMRFARMPFVTATEASDARFARGPRANFSTLSFDDFKDEPCSSWIPQWEPPRDDLLGS